MRYKLKSEGFREIQRSILRRVVISMAFACAGGLYVAGATMDESITYVIMLVFIAAGYFSYHCAYVNQKRYWDTYTITLNTSSIQRSIEGHPDYILHYKDISLVESARNDEIRILAGNKLLLLPKHLESLNDVASQVRDSVDKLSPL